MEGLYSPSPSTPLLVAARKSTRPQQIYADTRSKHGSVKKVYVDITNTPLSRHVWQAIEPPQQPAEVTHQITLQYPQDRREAWQEATPAMLALPSIRVPPKRKRSHGKPGTHKHASLRRELSHTILSAYDAARAPFKGANKRVRQAGPRRPPCPVPSMDQGICLSTTGREPTVITTRVVEISGPLGSPGSFEARQETLANKLFRQKSQRAGLSSPRSLYSPIMGSTASLDEMIRPKTSDQPNQPVRRAPRCRDSFARAKIHVRRPPKGCTHWFEAIDDSSDDDYPEAVETPLPTSAPAHVTSFQPSLGPNRARAAPTSFVPPVHDYHADYFSYAQMRSNRRVKNTAMETEVRNPLRLISEDPNDRSVLDLSSDEESPRSPAGWDVNPSPGMNSHAFLRRMNSQRKGSATPALTPGYRQSMASMQTTLTSGTIPFMLRIAPSIDSASTPPLPPLARHAAAYFALTGRPPTADGRSLYSPSLRPSERSLGRSSGSMNSGNQLMNDPARSAHFVALNSEEMALIEMVRRNRAAQEASNSQFNSPQLDRAPITEEDESQVAMPAPLNPRRIEAGKADDTPRAKSVGSTVTLETGEDMTFPDPPVKKSGSLSERRDTAPLLLTDLPSPAPTVSYWSPDIPTPYDSMPIELEGSPCLQPQTSNASTYRSSLLASPALSKRMSDVSLLRPQVFGGMSSNSFPTPSPEPETHHIRPAFIPRRESSLRHSFFPPASPPHSRVVSTANISTISTEYHMDFSGLDFAPVANLLSPSYGGLLTSTSTATDYMSACADGLGSTLSNTAMPSNTSDIHSLDEDEEVDDDDCTSRSPSLTDGGSLSGHSRSELDTPIREAGATPRIMAFGSPTTGTHRRRADSADYACTTTSSAAAPSMLVIDSRKLGVLGEVDDDDDAGDAMQRRVSAERFARHVSRGMAKLSLGPQPRIAEEGVALIEEASRSGSEASVEVRDAWNALGGAAPPATAGVATTCI